MVTAKPGVATELLHRIHERFRAEPDAPDLHIVVSGFGEQADMVRDGRADVAIAACFDGHDLDTELLATEPRVAALTPAHELAARDVLTTADLIDEPAPRWSPPATDHLLGDPARPVDGPVVRDTAQLLEVVALGQATALVPVSLAARNIRPDVAYRPVPDAAPYRTLALWPTDSRSPDVSRFVRTAHTCATDQASNGIHAS
ncbi:hypothetical protein GCM10022254_45920 [Actinomadura meridiana]|uniref:LysR substrate-binding domain-containing protein n=1 Tax=Actinomadura meridiana TaxID=559626 RepID=A0ABP8CAC3_9ACTN